MQSPTPPTPHFPLHSFCHRTQATRRHPLCSLTRKPEVLSSRQRTRQTKQRVRKAEYSVGPAAPSWARSSLPRMISSPAQVGAGGGGSPRAGAGKRKKHADKQGSACHRQLSPCDTSPVLLPIPSPRPHSDSCSHKCAHSPLPLKRSLQPLLGGSVGWSVSPYTNRLWV